MYMEVLYSYEKYVIICDRLSKKYFDKTHWKTIGKISCTMLLKNAGFKCGAVFPAKQVLDLVPSYPWRVQISSFLSFL